MSIFVGVQALTIGAQTVSKRHQRTFRMIRVASPVDGMRVQTVTTLDWMSTSKHRGRCQTISKPLASVDGIVDRQTVWNSLVMEAVGLLAVA